MRRLVPFLLVAVFLVAIPATGHAKGGKGVLTINGRIGKVKLGSTQKAVRRFAGKPTRVMRGEFSFQQRGIEYRYECGRGCFTSYYFNAGSRPRLRNFVTTSTRWRTKAGTVVGDDKSGAEETEGRSAQPGCGSGASIFKRGKRGTALYISFDEGADFVGGLALQGRKSVLGC